MHHVCPEGILGRSIRAHRTRESLRIAELAPSHAGTQPIGGRGFHPVGNRAGLETRRIGHACGAAAPQGFTPNPLQDRTQPLRIDFVWGYCIPIRERT